MKILSNDYDSNIPNSLKISEGGTANFSLVLSNFLVSEGHEWAGLIIAKSEEKEKTEYNCLSEKNHKSFWKLTIPKKIIKQSKTAKNKDDFEKIFQEPINSIYELITEIKPDLIFLNGTYLNPWFILKASVKAGIPVISKHPGIWRKELEIYKDLYDEKRLGILIEVEKDFSRLSSSEIFLNKWSQNVYRKEVYPIKEEKSFIIPLPIPSAYLKNKKKKNNKHKDQYKIGIVARWDRIKRHQAVLSLAKLAKDKKLPWTFHSVISIPETNLNKKLKDEYREHINIESPKNKENLSLFYEKMDLMILPSHFDVSPHVVPEALFCGTPTLISPNVGWIDEYKLSKAQKWIIDFDDSEKVIKRIKVLLLDPLPKKLLSTFKKYCRAEKILKKFLILFLKNKKL